MQKMSYRHGIADTPHAWIYYKDSGGSGTPLLMLHGNAETHLIFDYYEKKLSAKYRTILMDSRAHGRSELKPEYAGKEFTTNDMAKDVKALLDILHIDACVLLGFSDGANIALEFASLFPERTLSVIAVSGNISPDGLIVPLQFLSTVKYQFLKVVNAFWGHQFFRHQQLASLLCNSPMMPEEQLHKIKAPVLLIAGTWDVVKVSHSRRMAHLIPNAQLLLIKRATHTSMFGRKQLYLKIIKEFLEVTKSSQKN